MGPSSVFNAIDESIIGKIVQNKLYYVCLVRINSKSPTRNSIGTDFRSCEPSHKEESKGQLQPCERGFDCRLEILRQASRAIDPAQCSFDDPSFRQDDEARDLFVRAFDDRDGNSARLESRPLRLVALIAAIDKGLSHPRAFAMHHAKQRREGVAILDAGGGDLTFYRQAERIDGDMSFAALDFLAGVEATRPAGFRCLDGMAIDTDGRRRGFAALDLTRGHHEHADDLRTKAMPQNN